MPEGLQVAFRTDASPAIGNGHVMRCLTLANLMQRQGASATFFTRPESLHSCLALQQSPHVIILPPTPPHFPPPHAAIPEPIDILVVDHYESSAEDERQMRSLACRIVVIDDLANRSHDCDILIDQGIRRLGRDYDGLVPDDALRLLGPDYALLRQEFSDLRGDALTHRRRQDGLVSRILISCGGTDPTNLTKTLMNAVVKSGFDGTIDVVLGASSPHRAEIETRASSFSNVNLHVDARNIAQLMAVADLCLGAVGGTTWERCCLGLPSIVVTTAENQRENAEAMHASGAALWLGEQVSASEDEISSVVSTLIDDRTAMVRMSDLAADICDGYGARRVVAQIFTPMIAHDGKHIVLRRARKNDWQTLLDWQRQPETRAFARDQRIPNEAEHRNWLASKLADPDCHFHIIEHSGTPAGALRLDRIAESPAYEISIYTAPSHYRLGIALAALEWAKHYLFDADLRAEVLPGNSGSHALFQKAGYQRISDCQYWMPASSMR